MGNSFSDYELNGTEALGFAGGIFLAFSLMPQVIHTLKTRSTKDISYGWQLLYILGLTMVMIYFILIGATAAWITEIFELTFAIWLLCLKIKYDGFGWRKLEEKREELTLSDYLDLEKGELEYQSPSYQHLLTC